MSQADPATTRTTTRETGIGSVFVSNYPPYSFWSPAGVPEALAALDRPPRPETTLGLYLHVPFCRKRCKFCYFKVFTDKQGDEVRGYLERLVREVELYVDRPAIAGRPLAFVYFGGGTPSFVSSRQLRELAGRLRDLLDLRRVEEVTFECEPGTLTQRKLEVIREIGVTRLSLGVESFDDEILAENGRAHVSKEIWRVLPWIRALDFEQLNIDLIAGMVGERRETWRDSVAKTIEVAPDSVTIYQMELPFNTVYSRAVLDEGQPVPVADWDTKRAWQAWAFERLAESGYDIASAYTAVKRGSGARFVYRDSVWRGSDLMAIGVSSFGHVSGVHYQNAAGWQPWHDGVDAGRLPIERAYVPTEDERLTREFILQLKLGWIDPDYFRHKFGADPRQRFGEALARLDERGLLSADPDEIRLSREGLLRVDSLLPEFYAERYRNARYT